MTAEARLDLVATVSRLTGGAVTAVGDVHRKPLEYDAFLAGRALARVRGTAVAGGRSTRWSFIEKRTEGPSIASDYLYDNGRREYAAYRSGLLEDLAEGLRAPRLLAADESPDGGLTLWIEDLSAAGRAPLAADQVVQAARHLGRLAARWIGRVPDEPWLFRGWIERHSQPHAISEGLAVVRRARGDPDIERSLGGRVHEAAELIEAQDDCGSALTALRQTLCHHDAVAANIFAREGGGETETILIDWESVGPGPVGADLASLLFASPRRGDFSTRLLPKLVADALAAYAQGLAELGASVDIDDIRLGMHASISLRWTLVRDVILLLADPSRARRGNAPHETSEEALAELIGLVPVLLDSAAEARRLMSARGGER